jgi:feruloyl esterase
MSQCSPAFRAGLTGLCRAIGAIAIVALVTVIALAPAPAKAATADQCKALAAHDLSKVLDAPTRVLKSMAMPAKDGVPAYCRVEGYVAPQVGIEFHLPMDGWNGKFVMQGCGGLCGNLEGLVSCPEAVTRGYACGTTDMGHRGEGGEWAYNNLAGVVDLGYRATHVATVAGKAITETFYAASIQRAYFRGCSTGGRQGLNEAERFPYDFDGIIAGDPQTYSLLGPPLTSIWNGGANVGPDGKSVLTAAKLDVVTKAVLDACDMLDGVKDGLIGDPRRCKFDVSNLACKVGAGGACLTDAEMAAVRKFYQGPASKKGPFVRVGGMAFGTEPGWAQFLPGKAGRYWDNAAEIMRYLAFFNAPGPSYDFSQFDWDRDPQRLGNWAIMSGGDPDLELYATNGGKLIMFHGWADTSNSAYSAIHYYERMTRVMGGQVPAQTFARLFLLPGMFHCGNGYGVNFADMLGALDAWVETGKAPDEVTAYRIPGASNPSRAPAGFNGNNIAALNPQFSRPLYPYPDSYAYSSGDPNAAASFKRVRGVMEAK